MSEDEKKEADIIKKIERIRIPLGEESLTFFQMRDGIGVKKSNLKKDTRKHASILFSENGTLGIHSTNEKFPRGHSRRNKHMYQVCLPVTESSFFNVGDRLKALIQSEIKTILNPDLSGHKLLSFPIQPADLAQVSTIKGRKAEIDINKLGQIRVLNPCDLAKSTYRTFFVLKKAKTWWHNEGILFKSPNAEMLLFVSNRLVATMMSFVRSDDTTNAKHVTFDGLKYHNREVRALEKASKGSNKSMKVLTFKVQKKILLNSATTNMLIWGTGLKDRLLSN